MIIFARRARGGLKARNSWAEFLEKPVKFRYDLIMAVWRLQTDYGILTFFGLLEFDHNTNMWQMAELRCVVWGPKHGHSQGEWGGEGQLPPLNTALIVVTVSLCTILSDHSFILFIIWRLPHVFQKRLFIAMHQSMVCQSVTESNEECGSHASSTSTRKQFGCRQRWTDTTNQLMQHCVFYLIDKTCLIFQNT